MRILFGILLYVFGAQAGFAIPPECQVKEANNQLPAPGTGAYTTAFATTGTYFDGDASSANPFFAGPYCTSTNSAAEYCIESCIPRAGFGAGAISFDDDVEAIRVTENCDDVSGGVGCATGEDVHDASSPKWVAVQKITSTTTSTKAADKANRPTALFDAWCGTLSSDTCTTVEAANCPANTTKQVNCLALFNYAKPASCSCGAEK